MHDPHNPAVTSWGEEGEEEEEHEALVTMHLDGAMLSGALHWHYVYHQAAPSRQTNHFSSILRSLLECLQNARRMNSLQIDCRMC